MQSRLCLWLSFSLLCHTALALWPQPVTLTTGAIVLRMADNVTFITNLLAEQPCQADCNLGAQNPRLQAAINATKILLKDGFVPYMLRRPGEVFEPELSPTTPTIQEITLTQTKPDLLHDVKANSSYELHITTAGTVAITATSTLGLLYGLTTLTQIFYTHSKFGVSYTDKAPVFVADSPAFEWRGLNLDVARNFIPLLQLKRIIDAMSWNKMNRLHLHATDSQSWPLVVPALPELSDKGAFECAMVYTPQDFEELQRYAHLRGIEVVTEIDMPGHTASIHEAFPALITGYNVQENTFPDSSMGYAGIDSKDWSAYCNEPPCGQLKLNSTAVDTFVTTLLDDVLPRVSPFTSFYHAGGDEINKNVYLLQQDLNTNSSDALTPLISELISSIQAQVRHHDITPIVWEELLLDWNLALPTDTIIQSWLSPASVKAITERGYRVIAGSSSATYLDCGKGQWLDFKSASVPYQQSQGFVDYCSPWKNWKTIYSYDPLFNLTTSQIPFVLGLEVHAWSEQIDSFNIETSLWPRAAAAAEVGWSGPASGTHMNGQPRTLEDAGRRLSEWRERMVHRGIQVEPIHSRWCTQRPGQCSL